MRPLVLALGGLPLVSMPCLARAEGAESRLVTRDAARETVLVALEVTLPEACGDERALRARVERILGRSLFVAADEEVPHVSASLRAELDAEGRWVATIVLEDAASTLGQRTLDGRGCDTITDTASLVLALMLDLRRSDVVLTLAGAETVADSTEPLPATTTPEPARPRSSERWAFEARLGAGVALGVLPSVTPMARVRVGLTLVDRVALELSASVVPAERFVRGELGVRLGLYGFGLGVCPTLLVGDGLGLEGCVGVQGGVLEAAGVGLEASRDAILPAVAASAELRGSWWLADAGALTVATEVGVPLVAHRFTATDATEERTLLEMEPLFGRLELGLCARASL